MKPRKRHLSSQTIRRITSEYDQGTMPFHPMSENKHWRDNRMYFSRGQNWYYQRCLTSLHGDHEDKSVSFWDWAVDYFKNDDVKVVWCNVYRCHALHFITDEAKLEFLLRHGKEEPGLFWNNIKFPRITRVIPKLIAQDILSVQPMTDVPSLIFSRPSGFGMKMRKDDDE